MHRIVISRSLTIVFLIDRARAMHFTRLEVELFLQLRDITGVDQASHFLTQEVNLQRYRVKSGQITELYVIKHGNLMIGNVDQLVNKNLILINI